MMCVTSEGQGEQGNVGLLTVCASTRLPKLMGHPQTTHIVLLVLPLCLSAQGQVSNKSCYNEASKSMNWGGRKTGNRMSIML